MKVKKMEFNSNIDTCVDLTTQMYEKSNCERTFKDIIGFFYEDVGRCFQLINRKRDSEIEELLPSMFKWFCLLYSKNEKKTINVSDLLWNKFPDLCPYCKKETCQCGIGKEQLDVIGIKKIADDSRKHKPQTLTEWQELFQRIYPRGADSSFHINVMHLAEELAELSEAYRKKYIKKDIPCVEMELADVFSWIMGLANLVHLLRKIKGGKYKFGEVIVEKYKDGCPDCFNLRNQYKVDFCCCSLKEQKLNLISDYELEEEKTLLVNIKATNKQMVY